MALYFPLSDGTDLEVPDGTSRADAEAIARRKYPELFPPDTSQAKEGFVPQFKSGAHGIGTGLGHLAGMATGESDADLIKRQKAADRARAESVKGINMDDVREAYAKEEGLAGLLAGAGKFGTLTKETIAQSLPAMGAIAGGAWGGARAAAIATKNPWAVAGAGVLGGIAGAFPTHIEQMIGRQAETDKPFDRGAALAGAAGAAALDVAEQIFVLGTLGVGKPLVKALRELVGKGTKEGKETAEKVLLKKAEQSYTRAVAGGAARGVVTEVPVEVAQAVIERAQAGMPLLDEEAIKEYKDTAYTMIGPGAVFGGVGGAHRLRGARQDKDTLDQAKTEAEAAKRRTEHEMAQYEASVAAGPQPYSGPLFNQTVGTPLAIGDKTFGAVEAPLTPAAQAQEQAELEQEVENIPRQYAVLQKHKANLETAAVNPALPPEQAAAFARQLLTLEPSIQQMQARMKELEERGFVITPIDKKMADIDSNVKSLDKRLRAAQDLGDMEKISELGDKLAAAKAQHAHLQAQVAQISPPETVQPDMFNEAARQDAAAKVFDKEQSALQKQQQMLAAKREKAAALWRQGVDAVYPSVFETGVDRAIATQQASRQAAEEEARDAAVVADATAPVDRYGSEKEEGRRVASPKYQRLIAAVDAGDLNTELATSLGMSLKTPVDLKTPAGAVEALPLIEKRADELRGLLEEVGRTPLTGRAKDDAIKLGEMVQELRRLKDTAQATLRDQPRDLSPYIKKKTSAVNTALDVDTSLPRTEQQRRAVEASSSADEAFGDFRELVDTLRKGAFFGGPNPSGEAHSTLESLQRKSTALIDAYARGMLQDVAYRRAAAGLPPLTPNESVGSRSLIQGMLGDVVDKATNFAGKIKHDQHEIAKYRAKLVKELKKLEAGGGSVADAIAQARAAATAEMEQRGVVPGGQLDVYNAQPGLQFENRFTHHAAANIKNTPALKRDGTAVVGLQRRIASLEKQLQRRLLRTHTGQLVGKNMEMRRLLVEKAFKDAVARGASQAELNRLQEQLKLSQERSVELGVRDEEATQWKSKLNRVRNRLLNPGSIPVTKGPAELRLSGRESAAYKDKIKERTLLSDTRDGGVAKSSVPTDARTAVSDKLNRVLALEGLSPDVASTLQQAKDVLDAGRGSRALVRASEAQADRILTRQDEPFTPSRDPTKRGNRPGVPTRTTPMLEQIKRELALERDIRTDTAGVQRELFSEAQLPSTAVARTTAAKFRKFLDSAAVKKLRDAIARRKREKSSATTLLDSLTAQLKEQPGSVKSAIQQLLKQMYPVRQELLADLEFELPQSVVARLVAQATDLRQSVRDLPGMDASISELEGSQAELSRLQEEVSALIADAQAIESARLATRGADPVVQTMTPGSPLRIQIVPEAYGGMATAATSYDRAIAAAQRRVKTERDYLDTLQRSIEELGQKQALGSTAELHKRRAELNEAERLLRAERDAAAALERKIQQKIGERWGFPGIQRTVEVAENIDSKTGERVLLKEQGTGEPIQRKVTKTLRLPETAAQETKRLGAEAAKKAVEERRTPSTAAAMKNELIALDRKAAAQKMALERMKKALKKIPDDRRAALNTKIEESASALKDTQARAQRKQTALDRFVRANEKSKEKAIAALRGAGELPPRSAPSYADLRTGSDEQIADREERKARAAEKRAARRELDFEKNDAPVDVDGDSGTAYRIGKAPEKSVDLRQAQRRIDEIKAALPAGVVLEYHPAIEDLSPADRAVFARDMDLSKEQPRGAVTPDGRVIIIGESHENIADLEETVQHELIGHYGPDTILGPKGFSELSEHIWAKGEQGVRELAGALGVGPQIDGIIAGAKAAREWAKAHPERKMDTSEKSLQLAVARELVADVATYRMPSHAQRTAKHGIIQRAIKAIVGFLRKFAPGLFHKSATTQEIYDVLHQSMQAFESKNIGPYRSPAAMNAYRGKADPSVPQRILNITGSLQGSPDNNAGMSRWQLLGLGVEVQAFDSAAALSKAVQAKLKAEGLSPTDYKWISMMYAIRSYSDVFHHTTDVLAKGTKGMIETKRADGKVERTYGRRTGPSMVDVIKPLQDVSTNSQSAGEIATYYGILKRAEQPGVGWNKINLDFIKEEADRKKFLEGRHEFKQWLKANPKKEAALEKWLAEYQKFNHGLVDMLVESGAIPSAMGAEWKSKIYMPFYRQNPHNVNEVEMLLDEKWVRMGDITHQPYMAQLMGGKGNIMNFFESSIQNTQLIMDKILSNNAGTAAATTLTDLGFTGGEQKGYGPTSGNIIRYNVEPSAEEYAANPATAGQRHVVLNETLMGIPAHLIMHGLRGSSIQIPAAIRFAGIPGSWVRKWVTRSPAYAVRQMYNDVPSFMFTSGAAPNVAKIIENIQASYSHFVSGKKVDQLTDRLQIQGVVGGQLYAGTAEDLEMISRNLVSTHSPNAHWSRWMAKLDRNGIAADSFSRKHIVQSLMDGGMSEMEAILAARDALDFSRRGVSPSVRVAAALIPFMNTQMQALYSFVRAARGTMPFQERLKLKQKFVQRGLLLAATSMAYAMAMEDDEAYKNATPYERYYYWFMRVPGLEEPLRIRIPFEAGVIFKALPQALYEMGASDTTGGEALGGLWRTALNSNPYNLPPAFKLFVEQAFNVDTYGGRNLEDSRMENMDPAQRYRRNTSETAKAISRGMEEMGIPVLSPVRIENIINNFTTGTGLALFTLFDPLVRAVQDEVAGGVEGRGTDVPILGKLLQRNDGTGMLSAAYDIATDLTQKTQTYQKLISNGYVKRAEEYAKKYGRQIGLGGEGGPAVAFRTEMNKLKKIERAIEAAPESTISPERKRKLLDNLHAAQRQWAKNFRTVVLNAEI